MPDWWHLPRGCCLPSQLAPAILWPRGLADVCRIAKALPHSQPAPRCGSRCLRSGFARFLDELLCRRHRKASTSLPSRDSRPGAACSRVREAACAGDRGGEGTGGEEKGRRELEGEGEFQNKLWKGRRERSWQAASGGKRRSAAGGGGEGAHPLCARGGIGGAAAAWKEARKAQAAGTGSANGVGVCARNLPRAVHSRCRAVCGQILFYPLPRQTRTKLRGSHLISSTRFRNCFLAEKG